MPLRDHFRPPLDNVASWEQFHAQWPAMLVLWLGCQLNRGFSAGPIVRKDEYEVHVYDAKRGRRLVAAIEIVSPSNKDRPEHRRAFAGKCAALLQEQVSVTIVDLVSTRSFNLYGELLDLVGQSDPALGAGPSPLYAVACRATKPNGSWHLEAWFNAMQVGKPLPTVPLWLANNLSIPLDLEESYEETCKALRIV